MFDFLRKKKKLGVHCIIQPTEVATENSTFNEMNMWIYIKKGNRVIADMPFNSYNFKKIRGRYPVVFKPPSVALPKFKEFMGRVLLRRGVWRFRWSA